jgi:hypothetical protein
VGLLAKMATARITQPVTVPVAGWLSQRDGAGLLTGREFLTAACMSAVCGTEVGKAESPALEAHGRTASSEISGSSLRSLLQVSRVDSGARISCGAVGRAGAFVPDWELLVQPTGDSQAAVTVRRSRTLDGKLINGDLLVRVRDAVGQVLAGPCPVASRAGQPDPGELVRVSVMRAKSWLSNDRSPFAGDHFLPLPSAYTQTPRIDLPPGTAGAVADAALRSEYPCARGEGSRMASFDLSGGRRSATARLDVVADQAGERIEIHAGGEGSAVGAQRTFRAAMTILRRVAVLVKDAAPAATETLDGYVSACVEGYTSADRLPDFQPVWDKEIPADVVPVGAGLPVAITARTSATGLFDRLYCAQAWLLVQQRSFLVRSGRTRVPAFLSRRPAFFKGENGRLQARLSYMSFNGGTRPDQTGSDLGTGDSCRFWECRVRSQPDGTAALVVDAISQTDGVIGYGAELLTLMRAFCWSVSCVDPEARLTTLHL